MTMEQQRSFGGRGGVRLDHRVTDVSNPEKVFWVQKKKDGFHYVLRYNKAAYESKRRNDQNWTPKVFNGYAIGKNRKAGLVDGDTIDFNVHEQERAKEYERAYRTRYNGAYPNRVIRENFKIPQRPHAHSTGGPPRALTGPRGVPTGNRFAVLSESPLHFDTDVYRQFGQDLKNAIAQARKTTDPFRNFDYKSFSAQLSKIKHNGKTALQLLNDMKSNHGQQHQGGAPTAAAAVAQNTRNPPASGRPNSAPPNGNGKGGKMVPVSHNAGPPSIVALANEKFSEEARKYAGGELLRVDVLKNFQTVCNLIHSQSTQKEDMLYENLSVGNQGTIDQLRIDLRNIVEEYHNSNGLFAGKKPKNNGLFLLDAFIRLSNGEDTISSDKTEFQLFKDTVLCYFGHQPGYLARLNDTDFYGDYKIRVTQAFSRVKTYLENILKAQFVYDFENNMDEKNAEKVAEELGVAKDRLADHYDNMLSGQNTVNNDVKYSKALCQQFLQHVISKAAEGDQRILNMKPLQMILKAMETHNMKCLYPFLTHMFEPTKELVEIFVLIKKKLRISDSGGE